MKTCKRCDQLTVNPEDPPRYDVLSPENVEGTDPSEFGPYCAECWPDTTTGALSPA